MRKLLVLILFAAAAHADDSRIARVEKGLLPPVLIDGGPVWTIDERMRYYNIPGLSVAVVDDGKVVWAKGYGLADVDSGRPVTTGTMFLAGSISKPVTAMAAVDLVERGVVPFDADINTILRSWQLPSNELTAKTPVTMRQLLSHSAGTTVHGFPGYPRRFPRPTVRQVLDGEPPANTVAVRVDLLPNTQFRYSGGGTTIAQQALSDVTRTGFAALMRRHVLGPLGMASSTYAQPLPAPYHARAARAYRPGQRAIPGGWHVYPEAAAAGLWTTPSDLARVIVEMHDALNGRESRVLSIDGARLMLTPRLQAGPTSRIGIGFFIEDRRGSKYFGHDGVDEGFDAMLTATIDGSKGLVMMANSNGSFNLMAEVARAVAREYGWPGALNVAPPVQQRVPEELLTRVPGRYRVDANRVVSISRKDDALEIETLLGPQRLYLLTDGTFARGDRDERFRPADAGLEVIAGGKTVVAARTEDPLMPLELLAAGRMDDAIAFYRKTPEQTAVNRFGFTLLRIGRKADALRLFELNTELHPEAANTWDSLAEALVEMKELDRAAAATRKALALVDGDKTLDERTRGFLKANAAIRLHEIREAQRR
ncbi:MAG TPA: serine hydrolase domain-containing protein [Thermoanaerobaculia bacterium]|nr:serine hydrolase domain-containing protein [Thermoanaerobaculia bacterium]